MGSNRSSDHDGSPRAKASDTMKRLASLSPLPLMVNDSEFSQASTELEADSMMRHSAVSRAPDIMRAHEIQPHCSDDVEFNKVEGERRRINSVEAGQDKLFMSHCWRNPETQYKKRQILAHLSTPAKDNGCGLVYWADFLDLQAEGPVPWRKEIEEGIAQCSKFVILLDKAWLTSYNCLQELAMAIQYSKPVVVLVLDQEGWEMLTLPGMAQKAKEEADTQLGDTLQHDEHPSIGAKSDEISQAEVWVDTKYGASLSCYHGEQIVAGKPLSLKVVQELFGYISSINLCPCRPLEEENKGYKGLLALAAQYVQKDLIYYKEYAQLKNKAAAWQQAVRDNTPKSLLHKKEALSWTTWLQRAESYGLMPRPTDEMAKFVDVSCMRSKRRDAILKSLAVLLVLVLAAGVAVSSWLAVKARAAEAESLSNLLLANEAKAQASGAATRAQAALVQAQAAEALAEAQAKKAEAGSRLSTALASIAVMNNNNYADKWQLKLLKDTLARLPTEETTGINTTLIAAGHELLSKPYHFTKQVLEGHTSWVHGIGWSPSGSYLATCGNDKVIIMWAVATDGTAESYQVVEGHSQRVWSVAFSPDELFLASSSDDLTVRVWNILENGTVDTSSPQVLEGHSNEIFGVRWAPDGSMIASGSKDETVRVWTVNPNGLVDPEPQMLSISATNAVAWSPDGAFLAAAGDNVVVWAVTLDGTVDASSLQTLQGTFSWMSSLSWSPDGLRLASGSYDATIRVWDVPGDGGFDWQSPQVLQGHAGWVLDVGWSVDGSVLVSSSDDQSVRLWGVSQQGIINTVTVQVLHGHSSWVRRVAFSPNNVGLLASCSDDKTARLWALWQEDLSSIAEPQILTGHSGWVYAAAWAPDGSRLASSGSDQAVRVWPVGADGVMDSSSPQLAASRGHGAHLDLKYSPDGSEMAIATLSGALLVYPVAPDGRVITASGIRQVVQLDGSQIYTAVFSPDGSRLAIPRAQGALEVWSMDADGSLDNTSPQVLEAIQQVQAIDWAADGSLLAAGSADSSVVVFAVNSYGIADESSAQLLTNHSNAVWSVAFSPDGQQLASSSADATVLVWRVGPARAIDPDSVQVVTGHGGTVWCVTWSPDGHTLASSSSDWTVRLWGVGPNGLVDSENVQILTDHSSTVWMLDFSPNGLLLASAGVGAVIVWEVNTNGTVDTSGAQVLQALDGYVWSISFSPDGSVLTAASEDNSIAVWPVGNGSLVVDPTAVTFLQGHSDDAWITVWHPDGTSMLSLSEDQTALVWEVNADGVLTASELKPVPEVVLGHSGWVRALHWSPDGNHLASCGDDNTVKVWARLQDGTFSLAPQVLNSNSDGYGFLDIAYSPDGKLLAACSSSKTVQVWPVGPDGLVDGSGTGPQLLHGHADLATSLTWSPDGSMLATAGRDKTIRLWTVASDGSLDSSAQVLTGHSDWVLALQWSPDGSAIASSSDDLTVRVWAVGPDGTADSSMPMVSKPVNFEVLDLAWAPDGSALACASIDFSVAVLKLLSVDGLRVAVEGIPMQSWEMLEEETPLVPPTLFDFEATPLPGN